MPRVSLTSSIAAVRRDCCACSTITPSLAFVDYAGNRQYITQGNLSDNAKAHLFLIDYAHRKRVKIWGEARVVDGNEKLVGALMPEDYRARPEQVILFRVSAWDANCPQHIRNVSKRRMLPPRSPNATTASSN
jgi:predicted pyridoxine 5'-phosphate oxidase superfamily flavin-nucleotide-binding protein